jgi:hypothetical protein
MECCSGFGKVRVVSGNASIKSDTVAYRGNDSSSSRLRLCRPSECRDDEADAADGNAVRDDEADADAADGSAVRDDEADATGNAARDDEADADSADEKAVRDDEADADAADALQRICAV